MPGIFGLAWRTDPVGGSATLMSRMAASMRHHTWYKENQHLDEQAGLALGRIALGFIHPEPQPAFSEDRNILAVLDGEILDVEEQRANLEKRGQRFRTTSPAELVARGESTKVTRAYVEMIAIDAWRRSTLLSRARSKPSRLDQGA